MMSGHQNFYRTWVYSVDWCKNLSSSFIREAIVTKFVKKCIIFNSEIGVIPILLVKFR